MMDEFFGHTGSGLLTIQYIVSNVNALVTSRRSLLLDR